MGTQRRAATPGQGHRGVVALDAGRGGVRVDRDVCRGSTGDGGGGGWSATRTSDSESRPLSGFW
jgi:hypothetical protein